MQEFNETPGVARGTVVSRRYHEELVEMASASRSVDNSNHVSIPFFINYCT